MCGVGLCVGVGVCGWVGGVTRKTLPHPESEKEN